MSSESAPEFDQLLEATPYRAVRRLASGGMGEIYEAIAADAGERVAVKLLRADLTGQRDMVDRMRVEGEALALLGHPNIVAARGHGTTGAGRPYVAMEYLEGETLQSLVRRRGALPLAQAIHVTRRLLSALQMVHEEGIVHRDIKPENVMVTDVQKTSPQIKLLDFGVAKIAPREGQRIAPLAFPTMNGACVGTPRYAAPEQARGAPVDARTDLYAVGIVLYTLVAGRGPFDEIKGAGNVLRAHARQEPPPPSRFTPGPIPSAVESVILRAIAKDPSDRFADALSFSRELLMTVAKMCLPLDGFASAPDIAAALVASRQGPATSQPCRRDDVSGFARALPREAGEVTTIRACRPPATRCEGGGRLDSGRVSTRDVLLSAAAFAAIAGGLAMWFVR